MHAEQSVCVCVCPHRGRSDLMVPVSAWYPTKLLEGELRLEEGIRALCQWPGLMLALRSGPVFRLLIREGSPTRPPGQTSHRFS
jgi:hypothetical protein